MCISLTVFFEPPFYVGVFERLENSQLTVAKVVFGAEPSDGEVLIWVNEHFADLQFSPPVDGVKAKKAASNPKRRQRQAAQTQVVGIGSKSQQALQLAREALKTERKARTKEQREAEAAYKLQLHTEKKKEKHKGH